MIQARFRFMTFACPFFPFSPRQESYVVPRSGFQLLITGPRTYLNHGIFIFFGALLSNAKLIPPHRRESGANFPSRNASSSCLLPPSDCMQWRKQHDAPMSPHRSNCIDVGDDVRVNLKRVVRFATRGFQPHGAVDCDGPWVLLANSRGRHVYSVAAFFAQRHHVGV